MRACSRLWRSLEDGGFRHLPITWRTRLGADLSALGPFLHGTGETVSAEYPCPHPDGGGCSRRLIRRRDGRTVAVCPRESLRTCDDVEVTQADRTLHEVDAARLLARVAALLGVRGGVVQEVEGLRRTFLVATHHEGGREVGVYAVLAEPHRLQETVERLVARDPRALVVLTGASELPLRATEFLRARGGRALRLADLLAIDDAGALVATRRLGDALAADRVSDTPTAAPAYEPVPADACVFRREGKTWRVGFGGVVTSVGHTNGMEHIAELLRHPHREIHSVKLRDLVAGETPRARGSAGAILDEQALREFRERLAEIGEEVDEAAARGDVVGQEALEEEREQILTQLRHAMGLGGRPREAADEFKNAQQAVSKALHRALKIIEKEHAELGAHLRLALQIGKTLAYTPDREIAWMM